MKGVITRDIRGYVSRDWGAARAAKDSFWAARIAERGPLEGLRIAEELRQQMLLRDPGWPSADERHEDLLAHARLSERLRRGGRTGGR